MTDKAQYSHDDLPTIKKLLGTLCTRAEIADMLRDVQAPFSAPTKDDVVNTRVQQALDDGRLGLADVVALLREAEEHGRQHVFLYQCSRAKAAELLDETHVRKVLDKVGAAKALDKPRVLDVPKTATIAEVRIERFPKGQPKALIIKQVDRREVQLAPVRTTKGNQIIITRDVEYTRGVNVVRLQPDGLLEVRIQADRSIDYAETRDALLTLLDPLLPKADFSPISLAKAKKFMWENEKQRRHEYRLWWGKARTPSGDSAVFATGQRYAHLCDRPGMTEAFGEFLNSGSAACNAWIAIFCTGDVKPAQSDNDDADPFEEEPEELRVVLLGDEHEFYLTAQCSEAQYEHVLGKLREYNG